MKVTEEFNVKTATGKILPIEHLTPPLTYLDFGYKHLPRGFEGYRVKDTDIVVEKQSDGSFKAQKTGEVYQRV